MQLIVDGNNLAWAGYYGLEHAMKPDTDEKRARTALLGLGGMLFGSIARDGVPPGITAMYPVTRVAVCFDEGRPHRRREIYAPYQTGREGDPKFMQNEPTILGAVAEFIDIASALPIDILRAPDTEADDLIAGLVLKDPEGAHRIVSSDRDFLQLVGPRVTVLNPVRKLVADDSNVFAAIGLKDAAPFPRERFVDYRALNGDSSDDTPGVAGVGPQSAAKLLAAAPLDSYFGKPDAVRSALGRKSVAVEQAFADGTAEAIVRRNRLLMDLRLPAPCHDRLGEITARGTWDPLRFEAWMAEQRFAGVDQPALTARFETLATSQG